MTDSARLFINDTMAQLAVWREDLADRYKVGRRHWFSQQKAPFIWWAYGDISPDAAENHGATDKAIAGEGQTLLIKIWGHVPDNDEQESEEFCRVLKNDLLRALRAAGDGPNLTTGTFRWASEDDMKAGFCNAGAVLEGTVIVRLPVKADPSTLPTQFVTLTGAEVNVITGPDVVEHVDEELQQTIVIPPT